MKPNLTVSAFQAALETARAEKHVREAGVQTLSESSLAPVVPRLDAADQDRQRRADIFAELVRRDYALTEAPAS